MSRTEITYATFAAMMGDAYAVEIDQQGQYGLVYPEVYENEVLLSFWCNGDRFDVVITPTSFHELYINHECDRIFIKVNDVLVAIRILIPIPSTTDLADMLK